MADTYRTTPRLEARACAACSNYFVPSKPLPKYVREPLAQDWCSEKCYLKLHPPIKQVQECLVCEIEYLPPRKDSTTCGNPECLKQYKNSKERARRYLGLKKSLY